jgi:hypothetical protein
LQLIADAMINFSYELVFFGCTVRDEVSSFRSRSTIAIVTGMAKYASAMDKSLPRVSQNKPLPEVHNSRPLGLSN